MFHTHFDLSICPIRCLSNPFTFTHSDEIRLSFLTCTQYIIMGIQPLYPSPRMILYLSILAPFLLNPFQYILVCFEYLVE